MKDKDVQNVLALFPDNAKYYFTNAHIPRAMQNIELQKKAVEAGLIGDCFDTVDEAVEAAKRAATEKDVIMICGSFFIIAESSLL